MYYPYNEDQGGRLRDKHRTAEASEYLSADANIISLAKDVLTIEQYIEAENVAEKLTLTKKYKDEARYRLMQLVAPPPKRPIYYAQHEMKFLPRWTRDALRYLGDFVDMLVKSAVSEKMRDRRVFESSLGPAIIQFQKYWPRQIELTEFLKRYNHFLYRGAKHDFTLPDNRKTHRFTSREVVLTAYITIWFCLHLVSSLLIIPVKCLIRIGLIWLSSFLLYCWLHSSSLSLTG